MQLTGVLGFAVPYCTTDDFHRRLDLLQALLARLKRHEQWLRKRPTFLHESGFYFVHAGVAPGRPLDQQRRVHQLWIRNRFLWSRRNHGAVIVHGHTVVGKRPIVRRNRISIDTGAYRTGVLTCAVLHQGVEPEFLQTFVG